MPVSPLAPRFPLLFRPPLAGCAAQTQVPPPGPAHLLRVGPQGIFAIPKLTDLHNVLLLLGQSPRPYCDLDAFRVHFLGDCCGAG